MSCWTIYIYYKMIHGPYNVKTVECWVASGVFAVPIVVAFLQHSFLNWVLGRNPDWLEVVVACKM